MDQKQTVEKTTTTPHRIVHNPYQTGNVTPPANRSPRQSTTSTTTATTSTGNAASASATAATTENQQQQQVPQMSEIPEHPNLLNIPQEYHTHTLHKPLIGFVSFVPYPKTQVAFAPDSTSSEENANNAENPDLVRIFIGQLPYGVTDMQLQWMTQIFGGGVKLYQPEVIIKGGKKTGCVHALVKEAQLKQLVAGMHKRLLVDDSGVWVGRNSSEIQILTQYVSELKADPKKRYPDRSYDTTVVQMATSSNKSHNHQGLPTVEEYFAQQQTQFVDQNQYYG